MADMRRIAGIAMIVLAGVGVGAATTLRQQVTGGSPAAIAIPSQPKVGDCVLDGAELPQRVSSGTPTFGYGPCVGARAGEVVSVVADPWVDPGAKDSHTAMRDGSPSDAIAAQCAQDARVYAGLAAAPPTIDPAAGGVSFSPSIWLPVSALFPDDRQRAVGQDWVACVVESPTDTTFAGSVRAVFARQQPSGTLPAAFARCLIEAQRHNGGRLRRSAPGGAAGVPAGQGHSRRCAAGQVGMYRLRRDGAQAPGSDGRRRTRGGQHL